MRQLADSVGWQAIRVIDDPGPRSYLYRSDWVLVTANARLAERLLLRGPGERIEPRADLAPWTDDFHNLFQVLK